MREQALSITGQTTRNLRLSGYGIFAHQRDLRFFRTLGFLALAMKRVGTRLRVYPPGEHSPCPTPSHVETYKLGIQK